VFSLGSYSRAECLLLGAVAFLGAGEYKDAADLCNELADEGYSHDPNLLMVRGEAAFQAGRYDQAKADFGIALESLDEEHARKRLREIERLTTLSKGNTP